MEQARQEAEEKDVAAWAALTPLVWAATAFVRNADIARRMWPGSRATSRHVQSAASRWFEDNSFYEGAVQYQVETEQVPPGWGRGHGGWERRNRFYGTGLAC